MWFNNLTFPIISYDWFHIHMKMPLEIWVSNRTIRARPAVFSKRQWAWQRVPVNHMSARLSSANQARPFPASSRLIELSRLQSRGATSYRIPRYREPPAQYPAPRERVFVRTSCRTGTSASRAGRRSSRACGAKLGWPFFDADRRYGNHRVVWVPCAQPEHRTESDELCSNFVGPLMNFIHSRKSARSPNIYVIASFAASWLGFKKNCLLRSSARIFGSLFSKPYRCVAGFRRMKISKANQRIKLAHIHKFK